MGEVDPIDEASCAVGEAALARFFHTLSTDTSDRTIAYALTGAKHGQPVLLFYPLGTSRRLAALFDWPATQAGVQMICVNRPGMGGTSSASKGKDHLETFCDDVIRCLDHLGVKKAGVWFLCAGAPFAFSFCTRFPERTTGRVVGCSAWVSPSDCPYARLLYKLGAGMPLGLLAAIWGIFVQCFRSVPIMSLSDSGGATVSVSMSDPARSHGEPDAPVPWTEEKALFCKERSEAWAAHVASLLGPQNKETGGIFEDVAVLVQGAEAWGIDYKNLPFPVSLFHGEDDVQVPVACVEWLQGELPPGSTLHVLPNRDHLEAMLLHIKAVLQALLSERPWGNT